VQSLEVISGAPPAEYGGKTSVVINVTTRSGQGVTTPTGSIASSYGSFGSSTGSVDLSYGQKNWGNFIEVDGLNTGRFFVQDNMPPAAAGDKIDGMLPTALFRTVYINNHEHFAILRGAAPSP